MITKAERWFLGVFTLVASGVLGAAAILASFEREGLTCRDVANIVEELQDSPDLIPFQQVVVPLTGCETTITPKCSRLPDGTFCRGGLRYGKHHAGVILPPGPQMGPPQIDACNVSEGETIPCVTDGTYDPATYDPKKVDPIVVLQNIKSRFPDKSTKIEGMQQ